MNLPVHIEKKINDIMREENISYVEAIHVYEELSKLADIYYEDFKLKLKAA